MTDLEKIQKIVEFMGGWPEHIIPKPFASCARPQCDIRIRRDEQCYGFNPFTRIEDAMVVVEKFPEDFELILWKEKGRYAAQLGTNSEWNWKHGAGDTPARALGEAEWQVIDKLNKG